MNRIEYYSTDSRWEAFGIDSAVWPPWWGRERSQPLVERFGHISSHL